MNIEDVQQWCQANSVDAKMIIRGGDFAIRHDDQSSPSGSPPMDQLLHWELVIEGSRCPTSPSDMERLVTGRMELEEFVRRLRAYYKPDKA